MGALSSFQVPSACFSSFSRLLRSAYSAAVLLGSMRSAKMMLYLAEHSARFSYR